MSVALRFAPSPTGALHIGGARTAIFNYLYARKNKGKFYLRIEDTDIERSKKEFEQEIINSMAWLGLEYDGELVYQSKRFDIYGEFIEKLLSSKHAYYCTCSKEDLELEKQNLNNDKKTSNYSKKCRNKNHTSGVIRFKSPDNGISVFNDLILGEIKIPNEQIEDFVIARADKSPTYNFTVVIDDYLMKISHVIRGDDHLNNTPKQLFIYSALGIEAPLFAHVPMILGSDGKKLSKRIASTALSEYKAKGYLPEALFNYLVRLGWSFGDQEIFAKNDLINIFDIKNIGKSAAMLNLEKLDWLNSYYIKHKDTIELANILSKDKFIDDSSSLFKPISLKVLALQKERAKNLTYFKEGLDFILNENLVYDIATYKKYFNFDISKVFTYLIHELDKVVDYNEANIKIIFNKTLELFNLKMKTLAQASRVLLTNSDKSPGVFELFLAFEKDLSIKRLKNFSLFI